MATNPPVNAKQLVAKQYSQWNNTTVTRLGDLSRKIMELEKTKGTNPDYDATRAVLKLSQENAQRSMQAYFGAQFSLAQTWYKVVGLFKAVGQAFDAAFRP